MNAHRRTKPRPGNAQPARPRTAKSRRPSDERAPRSALKTGWPSEQKSRAKTARAELPAGRSSAEARPARRRAPPKPRAADAPGATPAHDAIYAVVRAIPRGRVATYGQIAELAGIPAGHRLVARALRSCPAELPWQRVVGRKDARRAQISIHDPAHAAAQRALLEAEAVTFDAAGFIVLGRSGWLPR